MMAGNVLSFEIKSLDNPYYSTCPNVTESRFFIFFTIISTKSNRMKPIFSSRCMSLHTLQLIKFSLCFILPVIFFCYKYRLVTESLKMNYGLE